jgi:hypothetical protein
LMFGPTMSLLPAPSSALPSTTGSTEAGTAGALGTRGDVGTSAGEALGWFAAGGWSVRSRASADRAGQTGSLHTSSRVSPWVEHQGKPHSGFVPRSVKSLFPSGRALACRPIPTRIVVAGLHHINNAA